MWVCKLGKRPSCKPSADCYLPVTFSIHLIVASSAGHTYPPDCIFIHDAIPTGSLKLLPPLRDIFQLITHLLLLLFQPRSLEFVSLMSNEWISIENLGLFIFKALNSVDHKYRWESRGSVIGRPTFGLLHSQ